MLMDCTEAFKTKNGIAPARIVVYRDGVPDSQLPTLLQTEVTQMKKAMDDSPYKDCKMTYLTVNKQVNARFFQQMGNRKGNPERGLLIDRQVVKDDDYDFYLIPHGSRTGVQGPTRFHVIYAGESIQEKALYMLTYRLCFGYYNF